MATGNWPCPLVAKTSVVEMKAMCGLQPYSVEVPPVVDVSERLAVSSERFVQGLRRLVVSTRREPKLC